MKGRVYILPGQLEGLVCAYKKEIRRLKRRMERAGGNTETRRDRYNTLVNRLLPDAEKAAEEATRDVSDIPDTPVILDMGGYTAPKRL